RGGSDTSAVAIAASLGAEEVRIFTDVDGFYTADPRRISEAKRLESLEWDLAIQAAYRGAQVLHPRCVELAWKKQLSIRVCSSFFEVNEVVNIGGTLVSGQSQENLEGSIVQLVVSKADLTLFRIELNSYQECAALLSKLKINGALGHMDWYYVDGFLF